MVSEAIINKRLTKEFPKMMEVVGSDILDAEKIIVVNQYIDILKDLEKAINGQD